MGEDSTATDGALQSTIHLPKQRVVPLIQGGREQRGLFPNRGRDLHLFSFFPQNLSPVATLLSQMFSQRRGTMGWAGTRACSSPHGLGIQTWPFLMLSSKLLLKALCGPCAAHAALPQSSTNLSWQPEQAQHKD